MCALTGADPEIIGVLAGPGVAHFCGHRISPAGMTGRFPADAEEDVAARIDAELAGDTPRYAYGSLASGADILWAEALLARGTEVHVVLPFARDAFIETSVAPSGAGWVDRFHRCLGSAFNVTYATENAFVADEPSTATAASWQWAWPFCVRAISTPDSRQLRSGTAGPTSGRRDRARRRHVAGLGKAARVIAPPGGCAESGRERQSGRTLEARRTGDDLADVRDSPSSPTTRFPVFSRRSSKVFAAVLERYDDAIEHRNTWGDALYVVLTDTVQTAECALELQSAIASSTSRRSG